jgi:hypothetical protein
LKICGTEVGAVSSHKYSLRFSVYFSIVITGLGTDLTAVRYETWL